MVHHLNLLIIDITAIVRHRKILLQLSKAVKNQKSLRKGNNLYV